MIYVSICFHGRSVHTSNMNLTKSANKMMTWNMTWKFLLILLETSWLVGKLRLVTVLMYIIRLSLSDLFQMNKLFNFSLLFVAG